MKRKGLSFLVTRPRRVEVQPGLAGPTPPVARRPTRGMRSPPGMWKDEGGPSSLGEVSQPGEDERTFRIRLQQRARERRDAERRKLEEKLGERAARLEERIRKADRTVAREEDQARQARLQTAVSIGATVLGTLFARCALGRATTAAGASAGRWTRWRTSDGRRRTRRGCAASSPPG